MTHNTHLCFLQKIVRLALYRTFTSIYSAAITAIAEFEFSISFCKSKSIQYFEFEMDETIGKRARRSYFVTSSQVFVLSQYIVHVSPSSIGRSVEMMHAHRWRQHHVEPRVLLRHVDCRVRLQGSRRFVARLPMPAKRIPTSSIRSNPGRLFVRCTARFCKPT